MSAADIKTMLEKLARLVETTYLSDDERLFVKTTLSNIALTTEQVNKLTELYNRLYSLKL